MMKKSILVVALLVSLALLALTLASCSIRLVDLNYETNTYPVEEAFTRIEIDTRGTDVSFELSGDESCRVVCEEQEDLHHSVTVEDGTLKIASAQERKWSFQIKSMSVTVYLPSSEYESLRIDSATGDVLIPAGFSFDELAIKLSTGNIDIDDATAKKIDLTVTTGKIRLKNTECEGEIALKVSTGNANLTDVTCKALTSTGSTGNLTMTNVVATESFDLERSTGNVRFESCDAETITVKTSTGKVTGSLQSDKIFITKTSTGSINVPETTSGGICKITTSTGRIEIRIER